VNWMEMVPLLEKISSSEKISCDKEVFPIMAKSAKGSVRNSIQNLQTVLNYAGDERITVDLAKELLDNGNSKTQEQWIEFSKQAQENNNFYVGDMPLYHAVFTALSKNNTKDVEEAMNFIKEQMRAKWLMTLTRIRYNPTGKDSVINNYNMKDEYIFETNFVGADEFIQDSTDNDYLKAILGTNNINEINEVYQRISSTDAHIWRVNSKPASIDERVAGFVAGSDRAYLYCDWNPRYSNSALGVRASREK